MESVSDSVRDKIANDRFAEFMGIRLLDLKKGYSKLIMTVTDEMINFHNVAHGGAIFALADAAFAAAANSHGEKALALCMNINFCSPAKTGMKLIAEAFEENLTKRTALYRITVTSYDGTLIASSQGTEYRKTEKLI